MKVMTGELLEAYCALAKAYCYLDYIKNEHNETKINELIDKIKYIEHEIYELSGKPMGRVNEIERQKHK